MPSERHWLHPQTVPRGFLRIYILTLLSRSPQSGYSIIQSIDERTEGAWRPGPGTMYPLLKDLQKEGLIASKGRGRTRKTYVLTPKGDQELSEIRKRIEGMGRKDAVMGRLFSDLLPGDVFMTMIVRRFRDSSEFIREKVSQIPAKERIPILRELRQILGAQIDWIDEELASGKKSADAKAAG